MQHLSALSPAHRQHARQDVRRQGYTLSSVGWDSHRRMASTPADLSVWVERPWQGAALCTCNARPCVTGAAGRMCVGTSHTVVNCVELVAINPWKVPSLPWRERQKGGQVR